MPVEDLGHNTLLPTTMDKKMKQFYQVPSIKVVAFKVEVGFTASRQDVNIGSITTSSEDEDPTVTDGTETFFKRTL